MQLDAVQPFIQAQIAADAALAAFGSVALFDPEDDPKAVEEAIVERLGQTGVHVEVGAVEAPDGDTGVQGNSRMQGLVEVYVAEKMRHDHTPKKQTLAQTVAAAVCHRAGHGPREAACTGYVFGKHERGYILHVLVFAVQIEIP